MKAKTLFRLIRRFLACLLVSAVFWSWIFNFLTDAAPENRILLYADMPSFRWKELAAVLEEDAPENIRWVKVHPFSYAMMNSSEVETADLYVMTAPQAEQHPDWLTQAPDSLAAGRETLQWDNVIYGIRLDPAADEYFRYKEQEAGPWYLFFGARSTHLPGAPEAKDDAAWQMAVRLLEMDGT